MSSSQQAEEIENESSFRLLGSFDENALLLWDQKNHERVCVYGPHEDYRQSFNQALIQLVSGNELQAKIHGVPNTKRPFWFSWFKRTSETTLSFVPTKEYVPGPADRLWETAKNPGGEIPDGGPVGVGCHREDDTSVPTVELQVLSETYQGDDMWMALRTGHYPVEQWYTETVYLPDEAEHVIVVNPIEKEYLAMLIFPPESDQLKTAYDELEQAQVADDRAEEIMLETA